MRVRDHYRVKSEQAEDEDGYMEWRLRCLDCGIIQWIDKYEKVDPIRWAAECERKVKLCPVSD